MAEPPRKDWLDIAIDFFFGAAFCDMWLALGFLRSAGHNYNFHWKWSTFWICLLATTLVGGSLAALYRNQFWSRYETYSVIPPLEESVSRRSKTILWILFALGCASLGLLLI
jgi:hypothetical protein